MCSSFESSLWKFISCHRICFERYSRRFDRRTRSRSRPITTFRLIARWSINGSVKINVAKWPKCNSRRPSTISSNFSITLQRILFNKKIVDLSTTLIIRTDDHVRWWRIRLWRRWWQYGAIRRRNRYHWGLTTSYRKSMILSYIF